MTADSPQASLLVDWIAAGAARVQRGSSSAWRSTCRSRRSSRCPASVSLASHRPLRRRHVAPTSSTLAVYTPADPAVDRVDAAAEVTVLRPGRHAIIVRFLTAGRARFRSPLPIRLPPLDPAAMPRHNWIDDEINATLAALRCRQRRGPTTRRSCAGDARPDRPACRRPSEFASIWPTAQPQASSSAEVDRLLASPEFVDYWTYKLAELAADSTSGRPTTSGAAAFHSLAAAADRSRTAAGPSWPRS